MLWQFLQLCSLLLLIDVLFFLIDVSWHLIWSPSDTSVGIFCTDCWCVRMCNVNFEFTDTLVKLNTHRSWKLACILLKLMKSLVFQIAVFLKNTGPEHVPRGLNIRAAHTCCLLKWCIFPLADFRFLFVTVFTATISGIKDAWRSLTAPRVLFWWIFPLTSYLQKGLCPLNLLSCLLIWDLAYSVRNTTCVTDLVKVSGAVMQHARWGARMSSLFWNSLKSSEDTSLWGFSIKVSQHRKTHAKWAHCCGDPKTVLVTTTE